jgi:hypothetical protein
MLPNMASALDGWEIPVILKTVTETSVDFVVSQVVTGETVQAVIQPAQMEDLDAETVDRSREYIKVHCKTDILLNQFVEFQSKDFKVITRGNYVLYGFIEVIAEETKLPLLEVTE